MKKKLTKIVMKKKNAHYKNQYGQSLTNVH